MAIVSARTIPPAANFLHPGSLISACRLLSSLHLISFRSASMSTVSTLSQPAAHNLEIAFTACSPLLSPSKLDLIFTTSSQPLTVAWFIILKPCCADFPYYCQSRIQQRRLAYRHVQPRLPLILMALLQPLFSLHTLPSDVASNPETVPRSKYAVECGCPITTRLCGYSGTKNMHTAIAILQFSSPHPSNAHNFSVHCHWLI
jgi:hypothetical protein